MTRPDPNASSRLFKSTPRSSGNTDVCPGRQIPSHRHWVRVKVRVRFRVRVSDRVRVRIIEQDPVNFMCPTVDYRHVEVTRAIRAGLYNFEKPSGRARPSNYWARPGRAG